MDRIFDNRRKNANRVAAAEYEYEYDYDHDNDYDTDLDTENRNRSDSQYYLCVSASWREPKYSVPSRQRHPARPVRRWVSACGDACESVRR